VRASGEVPCAIRIGQQPVLVGEQPIVGRGSGEAGAVLVARQEIDRRLEIRGDLHIRKAPHPGPRVFDLVVAFAAIEVDREHQKPLGGQAGREVAGVVREAPHVVDHHHARVRPLVRAN
jgi:hypothetical protein